MNDELEKLLAAATPGPWSEQDGSIGRFVKGRYEWSSIADVETAPDRDAAEGEGRANALLICAAVNALPELLAENEKLREALRLFMGAATPVSTEIDPRGYVWSLGYLDQARTALKETGQ